MRIMSSTLAALLLMASTTLYAQDKAAIQKKLENQYVLTQPTADRTDIVIPGSVLVLQKSDLMMTNVASSDLCQNSYKDGKISPNGYCKGQGIGDKLARIPIFGARVGAAKATAAPAGTRTYVRGEKVWVTKIDVKDNSVVLSLFTDAVGDPATRYAATLTFFGDKGSPLPPSEQIEKTIAEVFAVQPPAKDANADGQQQSQAPAAGGQQAPAAVQAAPAAPQQVAAEAPLAPIAPPPPPADEPPAPPQTIALGQTTDQVVASMGQPVRKAKIGTKEIYSYKDLKVTFVDGKVTDVQ
jgi:hypothetical protein